MKRFFLVVVVAVSILSCSKDNEENKVSDQILTGTVEGKAFTFEGGKAFYRDSEDTETITLYLTNEDLGCDNLVSDFNLRITADVPSSIGVHSDINIVTADGSGTPFNNIGESVEITAVSETSISGKMSLDQSASSISEESKFEGTFTIAICQ